MKTESAPQAVPFSGWKQNLIQDACRERSSSGSGDSPGPSSHGDGLGFGFEEKRGGVRLIVLFTLSSEKNAGFFKTGKIFEVRRNSIYYRITCDLNLILRPCSEYLHLIWKCIVLYKIFMILQFKIVTGSSSNYLFYCPADFD